MKNCSITYPKRSHFRFLLFAVLFCLGAWGLARFSHNQTRGFRIGKISHNFPTQPRLYKEEEEPLPPFLFNQPFYFLNRGLQSFVFLSEDGNYVLKLFINPTLFLSRFYSFFLPYPSFSSWALTKLADAKRKENMTFTSYEIAYQEMKEKTALVYLHTHPTSHLPKEITLIDPLLIAHTIDLNQASFLIQKRTDLAYPLLEQWISEGNLPLAKQALSSLIELFFWKWKHQLHDKDPLIRTNYGFSEGKAIQIDVGPLSWAHSALSNKEFSIELKRIMASLRFFLSTRSPELLSYLDRELEERLSSEG